VQPAGPLKEISLRAGRPTKTHEPDSRKTSRPHRANPPAGPAGGFNGGGHDSSGRAERAGGVAARESENQGYLSMTSGGEGRRGPNGHRARSKYSVL